MAGLNIRCVRSKRNKIIYIFNSITYLDFIFFLG